MVYRQAVNDCEHEFTPVNFNPRNALEVRFMKDKGEFLSQHIGFRVRQAAFDQIQHLADKAGRNVNDWCREIVLRTADGTVASPATYAVLAEITATQAILIDLLCAVGRDGRITTQKAQQIVDAAQQQVQGSTGTLALRPYQGRQVPS